MWDINADGYARGEGFAAVVLKPLSKAVADGDAIESVIRGTGVNQDGRSTGLTAPSAAAHAQLIKSTYTRCGLDCYVPQDRCQYFEAHGTGWFSTLTKTHAELIMIRYPRRRSQRGRGY